VPELPKLGIFTGGYIGVGHDQCVSHLAPPSTLIGGRHWRECHLRFAKGILAGNLSTNNKFGWVVGVENGNEDGGREVFGGGDDVGNEA
jgi:hypothetical protein